LLYHICYTTIHILIRIILICLKTKEVCSSHVHFLESNLKSYSKAFLEMHAYSFLVVIFAPVCLAWPIDSTQCLAQFPNQTQISYYQCKERCGAAGDWYPFNDIQYRIGAWIVPLFILIGSFHFNYAKTISMDVLHVLSDPIGTLWSLLSRMEANQCYSEQYPKQYSKQCSEEKKPKDHWAPFAIIRSALDECSDAKHYRHNGRDQNLDTTLKSYMKKYPRAEIFLEAAKNLCECRVNSAVKITIGTLTYIWATTSAFSHAIDGDFNNRTGHSIAFGMLYTWLIPIICLSSIIGGFVSPYSTQRILKDLQDKLQTSSDPKESICEFHNDKKVVECHVESFWENCTFHYHHCIHTWRKISIIVVSTIPVLSATGIAIFISYKNPTPGIECRNLMQILFCLSWVTSAFSTYWINKLQKKSMKRWFMVIKDLVIFLPQSITFCLAFVGWFDSCFCWSAKIWLGKNAYIDLSPNEEIERLLRHAWPTAAGIALGVQIVFVGVIYTFFRNAVHLYRVPDGEYESPPLTDTSDIKNQSSKVC
jgi:hypothetical protein